MTDTSAEESSLHRVASVGEIEAGESSVVDVDGEQVALFRIDDEYFALSNVCPHQGGPLGQGRVEDECVYCPWHGWQFDVESGEHVQGDDTVPTYDVVVEDGEIHVRA
ncbi:Rieske (2Fe-2S) protein [Halobellus limi]|jgi:nitrite reductase (NADH) small subunit|uniref:Nitrite reductase n=1 Tax=Halobellus limi TaxID=699433 RepID=A0A1H6B9P1_9EURY|nr:Rieske 2Fe-2S domain-containing protein [Halobellus limi]QCC49214.1 nitrite reductase [Halobellus limi]SEG57509.1 nitrite reductase (NADH) small subunit [Halobellus limi]